MDNLSPANLSRISIVGPSGSGKTRLSRKLHKLLHLPLFELDQMRFERSGGELEADAFISAVKETIDQDEWIIDGHYRNARELIWRRSQLVIWLDYSLGQVFRRLFRRGIRKLMGRKRSDSNRSTDEHGPIIHYASLRSRWNRLGKLLRERKEYGAILNSPEFQGIRIVHLRSIRQTESLCRRLEQGGAGNLDAHLWLDKRASTVSLELFGLPGAGKTTLATAIHQDPAIHTRHGLADEWRHQSLLHRAMVVLRTLTDLHLIMAAIRLAIGVRLGTRESLLRLMHILLMKHWLRSRTGILLFDQGVLQRLWSVLSAAGCADPDPMLIEPLLRAFYDGMSTQIVVLEVDKSVAASRVTERSCGHSRFDGLHEPDVEALMTRSTSLVVVLIEAAHMAQLPVSTLNGMAPVPELAESLEAMLARQKKSGCVISG